jgi:hypothetical protein
MNPAFLNISFIVLLISVLAFYRVRFSLPSQIFVRECDNHKRIDAF